MGKNPSTPSQFITPEEAAIILNVSETTIKKWLRSGKLKGSKLGGSNGVWRTTKEACYEMYEEGKNY